MNKSLFLAMLMLAVSPAWPQQPSEATIEAHVAAATRAAGDDQKAMLVLCQPAPIARPPQELVDKGIAAQIARPAPDPGQAFDNLYFVGGAWASAWALKTSDGIILLDAMNNEAEAKALIDGGMRKLGLDPAQIRYVIVSHGHGDHYGGAPWLVEKYKSRVVMSELDWKMMETKLEFSSMHWGPPPKRDIAVNDGDKVTLGGTSVLLPMTPGHTMGTLSPVFEVTSQGRAHRVLLWGGTAFNFGRDIPRLDAYIAATRRIAKLAEELKIDVMISNHAGYDGTVAKLAALRKSPSGPNPFVMGTEAVVRALTAMDECAQAQRDRFLLKP